jgi:protein-S-isoprenylcysteine O-methyltransferase Ste14
LGIGWFEAGGEMIYTGRIIEVAWIAFLVVWAIAARTTKPIEKSEKPGWNLVLRLTTVAGVILLAGFDFGLRVLNERFVPVRPAIAEAGAAATIAGILLAFWARYHLGGNWGVSGTVRVGHELVRTGPYAFLRHPIYAGIDVALAGTALAIGRWGALLGAAMIILRFWWNARAESEFLARRFGQRQDAGRLRF